MTVFLDTHAAVYLWEGRVEAFGRESSRLLESAPLACSPIVKLELAFLEEIGKLAVAPEILLGNLATERGVLMTDEPLLPIVDRARGLTWTRDPFDRLLVATAEIHGAPLITRDRAVRQHFAGAVW